MDNTALSFGERLMAYYRADYHQQIFVALLLQAAVEGKIVISGQRKGNDSFFQLKKLSDDSLPTNDEESLVWLVLFKKSNTFSIDKISQLQEASLKLAHYWEDVVVTKGLAFNFGMILKLIGWCLGAVFLLIVGWIFLNLLYISIGLLSVSAVFFVLSFLVPRLTSRGKQVKHLMQNEINSLPATPLSVPDWLQCLPLAWLGNKINQWDKCCVASASFPNSPFTLEKKTVNTAEGICTFIRAFTKDVLRNLNNVHGTMQGVQNQYDVSVGI